MSCMDTRIYVGQVTNYARSDCGFIRRSGSWFLRGTCFAIRTTLTVGHQLFTNTPLRQRFTARSGV
jgi:hypothetical protein